MSERTFKLTTPHMTGGDVEAWQQWLRDQFVSWDIDYPLTVDGDYGQATRSATASMCRAWGIKSAADAMDIGVTAWLRTKLRNERRTEQEEALFRSDERVDYRRALRDRYSGGGVCSPIAFISADSWGWVPGVHDGIDLICRRDAPLHAICRSKVVRADPGGWWGNNPTGDVGKGDGIIIIRSLIDAGPIREGMNLCYGHAEHASVKVGDVVQAGDTIGLAGLAVVPHVHFMVNARMDTKGVGDRNPREIYDYVRRNA